MPVVQHPNDVTLTTGLFHPPMKSNTDPVIGHLIATQSIESNPPKTAHARSEQSRLTAPRAQSLATYCTSTGFASCDQESSADKRQKRDRFASAKPSLPKSRQMPKRPGRLRILHKSPYADFQIFSQD